MYAGMEVSRALAKGSTDPKDLTADLSGLSEEELAVLEAAEAEIARSADVVGQVGGRGGVH